MKQFIKLGFASLVWFIPAFPWRESLKDRQGPWCSRPNLCLWENAILKSIRSQCRRSSRPCYSVPWDVISLICWPCSPSRKSHYPEGWGQCGEVFLLPNQFMGWHRGLARVQTEGLHRPETGSWLVALWLWGTSLSDTSLIYKMGIE